MELTAVKLPADTHNCRLNTLNIVVCLFNVIVPAIVWIYEAKEEIKVSTIAFFIE
jgi:hypothetical protein